MNDAKRINMIARLKREIAAFQLSINVAGEPRTPAEKTVLGRRRNIVRRKQKELACLRDGQPLAQWTNY